MQELRPEGNVSPESDTVHDRPEGAKAEGGDIELAIVAGVFHARPGYEEPLAGLLARYVVLARMEPGCRNIDLVSSLTVRGLFMVWEKWESHEHRQAHFEATAARRLASEVGDLVAEPPQFDVFDGISAHDLA